MAKTSQRIRTTWEGSESALSSLSDTGLYTRLGASKEALLSSTITKWETQKTKEKANTTKVTTD